MKEASIRIAAMKLDPPAIDCEVIGSLDRHFQVVPDSLVLDPDQGETRVATDSQLVAVGVHHIAIDNRSSLQEATNS